LTGPATFSVANTTSTTLGIGGAATSLLIGATTGNTTIRSANTIVNGNLGIGTASPSTKLHVAGTSAIARIDRTADASANPELQLSAVGRQFNVGVGGGSFATAAIQGSYYLYDATAADYRFVIDSSGLVGIGTSDPTSKLHVVGGRTDLTAGSETYALGVRYGTGTGIYYIGATNSLTPDMVFSQTGGSERMRLTDAGDLGVGGTTPESKPKLSMYGGIRFMANEAAANTYTGIGSIAADTVSISTSGSERLRVSTGGNLQLGATTNAGDAKLLVSNAGAEGIEFYPAVTSNSALTQYYNRSGAAYVTNSQNASDHRWSITGTERMRIDSSGNVLVTNPAGLGYGTGAGGTVTQATSKTTAVTLNKPTGQITMNNAALASGATVSFTVNNSLVASTDTIILASVTGSATYTAILQSLSAGQFVVRVTNISVGSLSDALPINFAIIKGATS
jgi:hypothetical protein